MKIRIIENDRGNPPGKLADAEIHFDQAEGILDGLKLIGFSVWERRGSGGFSVTFPARQYSVNGERRSFALLRPVSKTTAQNNMRDAIIGAWEAHQAEKTPATIHYWTPTGKEFNLCGKHGQNTVVPAQVTCQECLDGYLLGNTAPSTATPADVTRSTETTQAKDDLLF